MSANTPMQAMIESTPYRLFWLTEEFRKTLRHIQVKIDAGLSSQTAFDIACDDLTRLYRAACLAENLPPKNTMLEPIAVEMQARSALDAVIKACNGHSSESEVRKQFWAIFRKATNPNLTP